MPVILICILYAAALDWSFRSIFLPHSYYFVVFFFLLQIFSKNKSLFLFSQLVFNSFYRIYLS